MGRKKDKEWTLGKALNNLVRDEGEAGCTFVSWIFLHDHLAY